MGAEDDSCQLSGQEHSADVESVKEGVTPLAERLQQYAEQKPKALESLLERLGAFSLAVQKGLEGDQISRDLVNSVSYHDLKALIATYVEELAKKSDLPAKVVLANSGLVTKFDEAEDNARRNKWHRESLDRDGLDVEFPQGRKRSRISNLLLGFYFEHPDTTGFRYIAALPQINQGSGNVDWDKASLNVRVAVKDNPLLRHADRNNGNINQATDDYRDLDVDQQFEIVVVVY